MKRFTNFTLVTLALLALATFGVAPALAQSGAGWTVGAFLDEDGDGYNDLAPDDDGDGIPNGLDPDYERPLDGTGYRFGYVVPAETSNSSAGAEGKGLLYRFMYQWQRSWMRMQGLLGGEVELGGALGWGPGDGTGYDGDGPEDGTGYGPGFPGYGFSDECNLGAGGN